MGEVCEGGGVTIWALKLFDGWIRGWIRGTACFAIVLISVFSGELASQDKLRSRGLSLKASLHKPRKVNRINE